MSDTKPEPRNIHELRCHDCGFVDSNPDDTSINECPECEAPFSNFWVEKIFVRTSGNTDITEEDIENAEVVDMSDIDTSEQREFSAGGSDE